jgi:hypothetical protein
MDIQLQSLHESALQINVKNVTFYVYTRSHIWGFNTISKEQVIVFFCKVMPLFYCIFLSYENFEKTATIYQFILGILVDF